MLEVAVFADILTMKESLEFMQNIRTDTDYQRTSCCCPSQDRIEKELDFFDF